MKRWKLAPFLGCALMLAAVAPAQESGNWRAGSSTAKGVTGDIAFYNQKVAIDLSSYTVAQIRRLTADEITALFSSADGQTGAGNLYRTDIPGDKRFLHKNTLCGSEPTEWIATFVSGHTLQVAFFSGLKMPALTPDAMANTTDLCGTYSYVR